MYVCGAHHLTSRGRAAAKVNRITGTRRVAARARPPRRTLPITFMCLLYTAAPLLGIRID